MQGIPQPTTPLPLVCWAGASNGERFAPKAPAQRVKIAGGRQLPTDPLQDAKGRWTWINFWASWCEPCKKELPLLFQWQKELKDELHVAFVSMDTDRRHVERFLEAQPDDGLKQSYWLSEGEERVRWRRLLRLRPLPELPMQLFVDPTGKIRCHVRGAVTERNLAFVKQLIGAK
jgi:thiol-disulfide isomerase/thioredoxin